MGEIQPTALEGVVIDDSRRFDPLCQAMVEGATEFDWEGDGQHSLPEHLRERLRDWCRALHEWDTASRKDRP